MKIWIISNQKNDLSNQLEKHFNISKYEIKEEKEITKDILWEKDWIIETDFLPHLPILTKQATTIIYIKKYQKMKLRNIHKEKSTTYELEDKEKEFIEKYKNKIILLKNKKEIKKCLEAIKKDNKYWY